MITQSQWLHKWQQPRHDAVVIAPSERADRLVRLGANLKW